MTNCKKCEHHSCLYAGADRILSVECGTYTPPHKQKKSQTNADRIRAMSDEDLANFLHKVVCKFMCEYCKEYERIKAAKGHANCNGECDKAYLEWLKQPAEEEA